MELYAVLSDIHANYQALQAVEVDARREASLLGFPTGPKFISLGDVVDYGPQPNECVEWILSHAQIALIGNHDEFCMDLVGQIPMFDQHYWPISWWTRHSLKSEYKQRMRQEWLNRWPASDENSDVLKGFLLNHYGTREGNGGAIRGLADAYPRLVGLNGTFHSVLFGHTHYQGFFQEGADMRRSEMYLAQPSVGAAGSCAQREYMGSGRSQWWRPIEVNCWIELPDPFSHSLINPGSVGQPRSHPVVGYRNGTASKDAAYLLIKVYPDLRIEFNFRQVPYNHHDTVNRLQDLHWPDVSLEDLSLVAHQVLTDIVQNHSARELVGLLERQLSELVHRTLIPTLAPIAAE